MVQLDFLGTARQIVFQIARVQTSEIPIVKHEICVYTVWSFASSSFGQPGNSSWDHNDIHLNNTPHNHGFQILLGITVFLREIENDGYTKFSG